jgi:hypothetical protein
MPLCHARHGRPGWGGAGWAGSLSATAMECHDTPFPGPCGLTGGQGRTQDRLEPSQAVSTGRWRGGGGTKL